MKIAFPTQEDSGLDSPVYGHFGSAAVFVIVDTDTENTESVDNSNREHAHGQCQPLAALGGKSFDAVVVGGIGRGALFKLQAAGVRTFRAVEGDIRANLALFKTGQLPEFKATDTCAGHGSQGSCAH